MKEQLMKKLTEVLGKNFSEYELDQIFEYWTLEDFLGAVEMAQSNDEVFGMGDSDENEPKPLEDSPFEAGIRRGAVIMPCSKKHYQ